MGLAQSIGYNNTANKQYLYHNNDDDNNVIACNNNTEYIQTTQNNNNNNNISSLLDKDGLLIQGRTKGINIIKELKDICIDHEIDHNNNNNNNSNIDHLMIELNGY